MSATLLDQTTGKQQLNRRAGPVRSSWAQRIEAVGRHSVRYGLVLVLLWIGGMKFTAYEAAGISVFVANSPLMSWTYSVFSVRGFSAVLGATEIVIALLIASRPLSTRASLVGSALAVGMFLTTLSFLLTTPGVWEASAGGFPALSVVPGQFLAKDFVLFGASLWLFGDNLRALAVESSHQRPDKGMRSSERRLSASWAAALFGVLFLASGPDSAVATAEGQDSTGRPAAKSAPLPEGTAVPTARTALGPPAYVPLAEQPPAKIIVDSPLPDQLAKGIVVIQFRTEILRISPVFGREALAVSPRIGHLHVFVDDNPWLWAHVSSEELIIKGLPPGSHKVRIDLVNSNHETLAQEVVKFEVPRRTLGIAREKLGPAEASIKEQPKLIVEPPQPELLAHGVAYFRFRTENVQIAPVFGPAAIKVLPRIAHLQVTVDDAPWHWTDASGQPVDVGGLPSGPHRIRIALVDANGQPLAQHVVNVDVP